MGPASVQWRKLGVDWSQETGAAGASEGGEGGEWHLGWSARHTPDPSLAQDPGSKLAPMMVCHGKDDGLIDWRWGDMTRRGLEMAGADVAWRAYDGLDHELGEREIGELAEWIEGRLATKQPAEPKKGEDEPMAIAAADDQEVGGGGGGGGGGEEKAGAKASAPDAPDAPDSPPANPRPSPSSDLAAKQAAEALTEGPPCVPFKISAARGGGYNMHTASFQVPKGWEETLAKLPINARGSSFGIDVGRTPGTVESTFYSPSPSETAKAIGTRLAIRLNDPAPPGAEQCVVM